MPQAYLEVENDSVELGEGGEAEEDVDDVGGQVGAASPVLPQQSHQGAHHRLCQVHAFIY